MGKDTLGEIHKSRFIRAKVHGLSLEKIAQDDQVSLATVERSIAAYELHRAAHGSDEVLISQAEIVLHAVEFEKRALAEALRATRLEGYEVRVVEPVQGGDGVATEERIVQETKEVPDHEVRLHASEILTQKAMLFAPRLKTGTTVNVGVGVQGNSPASVMLSFEDRLRDLKEKRQKFLNAVPEGEEETAEAEVVDHPGEVVEETFRCIPLE